MSSHWTVYCKAHDVYGPDIIRTAGRLVYFGGLWPRRHDEIQEIDAQKVWTEFLDKHEWCELSLVHE